MNLKDETNRLRFAVFGYDGGDRHFVGGPAQGSGHPSVHPGTGLILTDAKPKDGLGETTDSAPIRLIDPSSGAETILIDARVRSAYSGHAALRVDMHPAWDRKYERIAFNAAPEGDRRVFVANLKSILEK